MILCMMGKIIFTKDHCRDVLNLIRKSLVIIAIRGFISDWRLEIGYIYLRF